MSTFFIRPKSKGGDGKKFGKRKANGPVVYEDKRRKKDKSFHDDEEIPSDDEDFEEEVGADNEKEAEIESDEEDKFMTPQEKRVHLAQKYLEQIQEQEKKRLDVDEVGPDTVLGRLKLDVLSKEGKLKRRIAGKIKTGITAEDLTVFKCKEHKLSVTCVVVSKDDHVFSGSKDGAIVKWSLSGAKLGVIPPRHKNPQNDKLHDTTILSLAVSSDCKYLAAGDEGKIIQIWSPSSLQHIFSFTGHLAAVTGLAFCPFTPTLYSASRDKTVKVWSVDERAYLETLFGHQDPITSLDVMGRDRAVTSGGTDDSLRMWKIKEESQYVYFGHERSIDCVKRLTDVNFVSSGDDGAICLWHTMKKKPVAKISHPHGISKSSGEPNWVVSIAAASNSDMFASGSSDGFVRLWKVDESYKNPTELTSIPIKGFVNSMTFADEGYKLILGIGQEHRLGRWQRIKEGKNSIVVVNLRKTDEDETSEVEDETVNPTLDT